MDDNNNSDNEINNNNDNNDITRGIANLQFLVISFVS